MSRKMSVEELIEFLQDKDWEIIDCQETFPETDSVVVEKTMTFVARKYVGDTNV